MATMTTLPAVDDSRTLGSRVYDLLRDDIIAGELAPGQKLTLDALKERYSVGTTPLREALYRLTTSLLVVAEDQRGFRVAPVSPEHKAEIVAARQHIEVLVLRDALEHGDVAWESRIVSAFHQFKNTPMYDDATGAITREWEVAHRNFHRAISSAARSTILLHFQAMLWDHAARYRNLRKPTVVQPTLHDEHESLVAAILDRDVEFACLLTRRHVAGTGEPATVPLKRLGGGRPAE